MFKKLSSRVVNEALRRNIVKADDCEEYIYGMNAFFTVMLNILSALIIGIIMNMILEIILFIFVYKMLRKYIGGSHSKNSKQCYISSCLTYVCVLFLIKFYPFSTSFTTAAVMICTVIVFVMAPVEAEKKPLDEIEKRVYARRSKVSILVFDIMYLVMKYIPSSAYINHYSVVVAVSICVVTLFAIDGKFRWFFNIHQ